MYYIEIRKEVKRKGPPLLIPYRETPPEGYNFRSTYAYDDDTANVIEESGSTAKLKGCRLYSDCLFLDVDTGEDDVEWVGGKLVHLGLGFSYWHTGNRGGHFHVPIRPMRGANVAYSQKIWVRDNLDLSKLDTTFYNASGQFRLPGAIHQKTGKRKELVEMYEGNTLTIPSVEVPKGITTRVEDTQGIMTTYVSNLTRRRTLGGRHQHIMILIRDAIKLGRPMDVVTKEVLSWNKRWASPALSQEAVIEHVEHTYYGNI